MKDYLDVLTEVRKVEAPDEMYGNILFIIENRKKNTISMTWIRIAAAAFLLLLAVEGYLIYSDNFSVDQEKTFAIQSIIPISNTLLIYD